MGQHHGKHMSLAALRGLVAEVNRNPVNVSAQFAQAYSHQIVFMLGLQLLNHFVS